MDVVKNIKRMFSKGDGHVLVLAASIAKRIIDSQTFMKATAVCKVISILAYWDDSLEICSFNELCGFWICQMCVRTPYSKF